ncbi:MAG TPA: hypothetical protein VD769_04455 [Gaiellaceae bacterium]|nr:hypothetical protein [Gaiellaceae bacterium]
MGAVVVERTPASLTTDLGEPFSHVWTRSSHTLPSNCTVSGTRPLVAEASRAVGGWFPAK